MIRLDDLPPEQQEWIRRHDRAPALSEAQQARLEALFSQAEDTDG